MDFCILFYVGPGPNPVPEPVCVTVLVPLRQKVEIPAVSVPDPVHTNAHGRNHTWYIARGYSTRHFHNFQYRYFGYRLNTDPGTLELSPKGEKVENIV